jgi:hypothetical protein
VRRVAAVGIPISLAASAAVSFQGLTGLGALVGIAHPWLLPISIDVYAVTSTLIAMLLPEGHRARRTAVWNARLGLAMSMAGNAVFRAVHLGSYAASDIVLTFVGAWPSLIVERLLHLQGRLADSHGRRTAAVEAAEPEQTATVQSATVQAPPVSPATVQPAVAARPLTPAPATAHTNRSPAPATAHRPPAPTVQPASGASARTTVKRWVEIGHPVYVAVQDATGRRPTENAYRDALAEEVARLIAAGQLAPVYAEPSVPTAKRVRKDVEDRHPEVKAARVAAAGTAAP